MHLKDENEYNIRALRIKQGSDGETYKKSIRVQHESSVYIGARVFINHLLHVGNDDDGADAPELVDRRLFPTAVAVVDLDLYN